MTLFGKNNREVAKALQQMQDEMNEVSKNKETRTECPYSKMEAECRSMQSHMNQIQNAEMCR